LLHTVLSQTYAVRSLTLDNRTVQKFVRLNKEIIPPSAFSNPPQTHHPEIIFFVERFNFLSATCCSIIQPCRKISATYDSSDKFKDRIVSQKGTATATTHLKSSQPTRIKLEGSSRLQYSLAGSSRRISILLFGRAEAVTHSYQFVA
jgi:hypothetical protein